MGLEITSLQSAIPTQVHQAWQPAESGGPHHESPPPASAATPIPGRGRLSSIRVVGNAEEEVATAVDAKPGVNWKALNVGTVASFAQRYGRYSDPVDWPLLMTAAFLVCFTIGNGFLAPLRYNMPWKAAYFAINPFLWAYGLWFLWTRRAQPGDKFKAFVLQEGFVYSRMLETYTWVWIGIVYAVFITLCSWGSLFFRFHGAPLPGSRNYMWVYPYFVNLPLALALDPVSSTTAFKDAARKKGYPGMANAHDGFHSRYVLLCIHVVVVYLAWLLVSTPGGIFFQYDYDMIFLYFQLVFHTLMAFIVLPRYAGMLKSGEPAKAMSFFETEERHTSIRFLLSRMSRNPDKETEEPGEPSLDSTDGEAKQLAVGGSRVFSHMLNWAANRECNTEPQALLEDTKASQTRNDVSEDGDDFAASQAPAPSSVSGSTGLPLVQLKRGRRTNSHLAVRELLGAPPQLHNEKNAFGGGGRASEDGAWDLGASRDRRIKFSDTADARCALAVVGSTRGSDAAESPGGFATPAATEVVARRQLNRIQTTRMRESTGTAMMSVSGRINFPRWFKSISGEFFAAVLALPRGIRLLVINLVASLRLFAAHWDWWAATQPHKFLLTGGMLVVASVLWILAELPAMSNRVSMVLFVGALAWVILLTMVMMFSPLANADQTMVLKVASEGGSIGSGLVFSTSSILNALTFGEPVAQGYAATEERLLKSAAISCRWDYDAAWPLEVQERGWGRTRHCMVMFPCLQFYRAALAARQAGCHYMWIDTLSVPQPDPEDPPELAQLKTNVLRRLIPSMTAVYSSVRLVIVVETAWGQRTDESAYNRRTWTVQECMINRNTSVVHLDGRYTVLGDASSRRELSGLADDRLTKGMDDLGSYTWILQGDERTAALRTSRRQRRAFSRFADTRGAARAADKAVALGQIFFRVLFEHIGVAISFMMEMVVLLAEEESCGDTPFPGQDHAGDEVTVQADGNQLCVRHVMLIDNTGWDPAVMTGSAARTRYLMGKPSFLEKGKPTLWNAWRVPLTVWPAGQGGGTLDNPTGHRPPARRWWLCELQLQGMYVQLAVLPGEVSETNGGRMEGHLHQLRTCSAAEKATINTLRNAEELEPIEILWH